MEKKSSNRVVRWQGAVRIHVQMEQTSPVQHALRMLFRDFAMVLGTEPELVDDPAQAEIVVRQAVDRDACPPHPEAFAIRFEPQAEESRMAVVVAARDDLGFVYGLLYLSEKYLGIQSFWFWADQSIVKRDAVEIACEAYDAPPSKVRFRGWFVNDEVCLIGWKEPYPPSREVWLPVFEALLRCGGNMVIPGTDLPKTGVHAELAAEMGLWLTHHHAEPLGAEMFLRAYTGRSASYKEAPELFEGLWREAIEKQKDDKILWVLSFRGQGDKPFWENDPSFDTPEKRGAMISYVIQRQYDMIRERVADPVACVALYGEIAELYKAGHVELPTDVIKIWADNGYGKMVSRRHGNLNLRIPALPDTKDAGKHGIYYHVTFHDLQASNHLTMFPGSADFLKLEVEAAFTAGATEYVLVNCGNIRMHVYTLDILRELWQHGSIDTTKHLRQFTSSYYAGHHAEIEELYRSYSEAAIAYGPNTDDLVGDEFYHHPVRRIVGHWLQGRSGELDPGLIWATPGAETFAEQVRRFEARCEAGAASWSAWLDRCNALIAQLLHEEDRSRVIDHLRLQGVVHQSGAEGFLWLCRSFATASQGHYPQAFVHASQAMWSYQRGLQALRESEHGKWEGFYSADWLTNVQSTVNNMETLRRFLRMQGDSPDFFLWYKEYLMSETEKYIYLENTHRNPLSDDELAGRLQQFFGL